MKTTRCLVCALLLLGFAPIARGSYHELSEPALVFPLDFPQFTKTNILARLRRTDCKFVEGSALNAVTTLKYAGDTAAINRFMQDLATCPGATLSVRFDGDPGDDSDWTIHHNAHQPGDLVLRVNLKSKQIKLDALGIPQIKGPIVEAK
jgi:hypothetical protein